MPLTREDLEAVAGVVNTAVEARFSALQTGIDTRLGKIELTVTKLEAGDEEDDEEKKKKKKEDDDAKSGLSAANIHKSVLSAVREIFPKTTVENLTALAAGNGGPAKNEYAEKLQLCEAAGITGARAIKHIANKWPAVYTTQFGNGGGQKGSAKATI